VLTIAGQEDDLCCATAFLRARGVRGGKVVVDGLLLDDFARIDQRGLPNELDTRSAFAPEFEGGPPKGSRLDMIAGAAHGFDGYSACVFELTSGWLVERFPAWGLGSGVIPLPRLRSADGGAFSVLREPGSVVNVHDGPAIRRMQSLINSPMVTTVAPYSDRRKGHTALVFLSRKGTFF
jgi:hypothetical protein